MPRPVFILTTAIPESIQANLYPCMSLTLERKHCG